MSPVRRRLTPDQRRRELLDAAIRLFRRRSPEECRVEDVTTEAGTAKGNFYRYFDSYDALIVAIRNRMLDDYRIEAQARMAARSTIDWWTILDEEIDAYFTFDRELGGLHDALFHGPAARAEPIAEPQSAEAFIGAMLEAGVAAGAFAAVDIEPTAVLIFHVLHGAADHIASGADPERTVASAKRMIERAVGKPV